MIQEDIENLQLHNFLSKPKTYTKVQPEFKAPNAVSRHKKEQEIPE